MLDSSGKVIKHGVVCQTKMQTISPRPSKPFVRKNSECLPVYRGFKKYEKLMGNDFEIIVVTDDEYWANTKIESAMEEIRRIENLLSTCKENSQTNQINQHAGIAPAKVDKEVFDLCFN